MAGEDKHLRDRLPEEAAEHVDDLAENEADPEKRIFWRQVAHSIRDNISTTCREYHDIADIGAWFDVPARTVSKWLERYDDTPAPDVVIGGRRSRKTPGWSPGREVEWREWHAARPGRNWRRKQTP